MKHTKVSFTYHMLETTKHAETLRLTVHQVSRKNEQLSLENGELVNSLNTSLDTSNEPL